MFNSENPFISVCQYVILVQTALTSDPAASEGQVSINIQGEYGDTGERKLSGKSPWKPGEEASFIIESVSLGALTKIKLQFEGQGKTIWFVLFYLWDNVKKHLDNLLIQCLYPVRSQLVGRQSPNLWETHSNLPDCVQLSFPPGQQGGFRKCVPGIPSHR